MARCRLPLGVQLDQLLGYVLDSIPGLGLLVLPLLCAKLAHHGGSTFFPRVFRNLVEGVNAHIEQVIIAIDKTNCLLLMAVYDLLLETSKLGDTIIDVCDKIAGLQRVQFAEGERLRFGKTLARAMPVEALEDLMIGITNNLQGVVDKALA